jgi:penicillin-binding protein 1C
VRMAWKTGTSWGHRDAWTLAWTPRWTVGVWLGNFRGTASRALVGTEAAAPVAARIMDSLCRNARDDWFTRPASVSERTLCTVSGAAPGAFCSSTTSGLAVGKSPRCTVCREVCIDTETGEALCPACKEGRAHERRVVHAWPPETSAWLRAQGNAKRLAPPHRTTCALARAQSPAPQIIAPVAGRSYRTGSVGLPLHATGRPGRLFWFVDGKLLATSSSGVVAYVPVSRGVHELVCADESGVSAQARVTVE